VDFAPVAGEQKRLPLYAYWNIIDNMRDVFIRPKRTGRNRQVLNAIDTFKALALLWMLATNIQVVVGQYVTGFDQWLTSLKGISYLISGGEGCPAFCVVLVLLGYATTRCMSGPIADAIAAAPTGSPSQERPHLTHSFSSLSNYFSNGIFAIAPSMYISICISLFYGYFSSDSDVKNTFYTSCKRNWWTNIVFVTDLSLLWSPYDDIDTQKNTIGEGYMCYPTLWAVSCAVQLCIMSIPILLCYSYRREAGYLLVFVWLVGSLVTRTLISEDIKSEVEYAIYVEYVPWTRGDAFALGMALFMYHQRSMVMTEERRGDFTEEGPTITTRPGNAEGAGASIRGASRSVPTNKLKHQTPTAGDKKASLSPFNRYFSDLRSPASPTYDDRDDASDGAVDIEALRTTTIRGGADGSNSNQLIGLSSSSNGSGSSGGDDVSTSATASQALVSALWKIFELFVAFVLFYTCLVVLATPEDPAWFAYFGGSNWQYRNFILFSVAVMTFALMLIVLDGTLWPISWFFNQSFFYPIASLAYTSFLLQVITVFVFCQSLDNKDAVRGEVLSWSGNMTDYVLIYFEILLANLSVALLLSLLIERPLYRLARASL